MAVLQAYLSSDISILKEYQQLVSTISSAFSTFGWVQSSDTGQVTPSGITALPSQGSFTNYQIWMMGDSNQSSNPVYVKIAYGTSSSNFTYPALQITAGSGSNGSGTILNAGNTFTLGSSSTGGVNVPFECDFSGDKNRFQMILFRGLNGNYMSPTYLSIERSHNTSGGDTTSYFTVVAGSYHSSSPYSWQQSVLPSANGGPLFLEPNGLTIQTNNTTSVLANTVAAAPFFPFVGMVDNPLLGLVCVKTSDFSDGAQITVNLYGSNHNYLVSQSNFSNWGAMSTNSIAMRYE